MITISTNLSCTTKPFDKAGPTQHTDTHKPACCIIVQPNQSANWRGNTQLIIALGLPCIVIATTFSLTGAWLILPLAGIEIIGLIIALYTVCKRQQHP